MIEQTRTHIWRYGSIAFFCGLPLLLVALTVSDLTDANQASEQAERKRATTAAIVAKLAEHQSRVATPADMASLYLQSSSDTLARAEVQERAAKLAAQAGGRIVEMRLTTTPEQETAGTVAIQLSLDIDNSGLLDLLYKAESGLPLLDVTDLSVQGNDERSDRGSRNLHVDMIVRGHWRKVTG